MTKTERGWVPSTSTVVRITNNNGVKIDPKSKVANKDHGVKNNNTTPGTLKPTKDTTPKSTTSKTTEIRSVNIRNALNKAATTKSTLIKNTTIKRAPTKEIAENKKESVSRIAGQKTKRAFETKKIAEESPQKKKKENTKGKAKAIEEEPFQLKIIDDPLNYETVPEDIQYEAESIVSHQVYRSKVITYVIKWVGWSHKDNTTENASDIHADVPELCRAYWSKMDPSQIMSNVVEFTKQGNVNNKTTTSTSLEYRKKIYSQKHIRPRMASNGYVFNSKWPNNTTNWEADMKRITSVLPSVLDEKLLFGYIEWLNGQRTVHFITDLHKHCPEKVIIRLISYYEDRLRIF